MDFPPAFPDRPLERIGDDLFMVRGAIDVNRWVRISRNMAVVRQGAELTLINAVRLDEPGLRDLDALGEVRHLVRLGSFHGHDDPFYMARYRPTFWGQPGGARYPGPPIERALSEGGPLPFAGARAFCFTSARQPEAALALAQGVLVTCDALQHYGDFTNHNLPARLLMPALGFRRETLIGPLWLKAVTPRGGSLRADFERLLTLPFDSLLAAHGTFLETGAHAAVARAVAKTFRL